MATLLGFDFGTRKIGIAVGQTVTRSATPLTTLRNRQEKPDWPRIESLIREWQPEALVVGLPFNMDDTEVDWSGRVHRFARQLNGRFGLEVHLIDERLTSLEAQRLIAEGPATAKSTTPDAVDAFAAALILETWLCEQHQHLEGRRADR
ncbi:Holliday junction resolvase [Marichromatium purpuratum 984]|uniref:Putative pre-16S rRNA nuclease n=2 Tax=Marichromatium TaxID=85076 RepID=W0E7H6_MARPU|nr:MULTISPECIES: Holliday junction resolvase RuvX [Marichromatium]AHF05159.1 Holliday junction resolvase [Marichromatium purpuratum 984]KXX63874.1 crossover junction endodeoxyribonuclease RuvA [Marichromatium gracile]MBK1707684.1 Holliday junction resolvase RuvX [Marichromatium gracile]TCW40036.1 putative Holliday junction resolvase [Marichromatium gracile]